MTDRLRRLLAGLTVAPALLASAAAAATSPPSQPVGSMVAWSSDQDGPARSFVSGDVTVSLTIHRARNGDRGPQITVSAPGARPFTLVGDATALAPAANAGVGRLDAKAQGLQVLFADYTGGAHCCDHLWVLERRGGAWKAVEVANVEGGPLETFPKDLDGDGVADIVLDDDRFAYAFTFYAASYMPPRIFNVVNGKVVDVSKDPKYAAVFREDMARAERVCRGHGNGGCAAYVADAARLGRFAEAWPVMLANYDRTADWDWPPQCRVHAPPGHCPKSEERKFSNMPDALKAFLAGLGYIPAG